MKSKSLKILIFDIETSPLITYTWGLFDQNIALNQIKEDWHVLSYAAKWLDDKPNKIMYKDQRGKKVLSDDKELLKGIWKLLDEASVVITQNGISFDSKKLNARFILNGLGKPSPYRHIDTLRIARKNFAFTSNKLEYMTNKLCTKYKKLTDERKFSGFSLWKECLKDNIKAWREMERYNKYDVLSLEELYHKLQPWDTTIAFSNFTDNEELVCNCGSTKLQKRGFDVTSTGKYQRYQCQDCGKWHRDKTNLLTKEKRKSTLVGI